MHRAGAAVMSAGAYYPGPNPPDAAELRVLGCLVEKRRTTPDAYPLSVNALRVACNQSTNRDPVVDYDERAILEALERLGRRGWTRLASGAGSRARKYRHLLGEALALADDELALLGVLMLRGPQTPGELKQRGERLHAFADMDAVLGGLERLVARELVARLSRRPGQKEQRYVQLLDGGEDGADVDLSTGTRVEDAAPAVGEVERAAGGDRDRLDRLERELSDLRDEVRRLRDELGGAGSSSPG